MSYFVFFCLFVFWCGCVCVVGSGLQKKNWGEGLPLQNLISFDPFINCIVVIFVNFIDVVIFALSFSRFTFWDCTPPPAYVAPVWLTIFVLWYQFADHVENLHYLLDSLSWPSQFYLYALFKLVKSAHFSFILTQIISKFYHKGLALLTIKHKMCIFIISGYKNLRNFNTNENIVILPPNPQIWLVLHFVSPPFLSPELSSMS